MEFIFFAGRATPSVSDRHHVAKSVSSSDGLVISPRDPGQPKPDVAEAFLDWQRSARADSRRPNLLHVSNAPDWVDYRRTPS
jgi:hypothetical protein